MEIYKSFMFTILMFIGVINLSDAKAYSQANARKRLMQDLLINYNPSIRPAIRDARIDLRVNLELHHFNFRAKDGSFEFFGKLFVSWHDQKLRWTPLDYDNATEIYIPQTAIWIPDLEIYNNAPDKFLRMNEKGLVKVESTGNVTWVDTIEVNAFCAIETFRWPNDRHSCMLVLGSWTYDGNMVNFDKKALNSTLSTGHIAKNPEFKLLNHTIGYVTTVYSCCEESYVNLNYNLEFERRASFVIIFQMPALCVIVLTLGAFCLEPHRGEKMFMHGISILLIVFQLIYYAKNISRFGQRLPLYVIFYSISMVLVTFAVIISVFTLRASRSKSMHPLPLAFLKLLKSRLGALLETASTHSLKSEYTEEVIAQFDNDKSQEHSSLILTHIRPNDWTRFAYVVQRMAIGVYSLIFLLLASICFM